MSPALMWCLLAAAAFVTAIACTCWLVMERTGRRGTVPRCPSCEHARAAHNGTGCHVRIAVTNGSKPCLCSRPYGEPR